MQNSIVSYVGWLLLAAAFGFYAYGIYEAIRLSWSLESNDKPLVYYEVLSTTVGAIQALLLANLGMVLGISISKPQSGVAKALKLNRGQQIGVEAAPLPPTDLREKIQLWAVVIYVVALIACLITWIVNKFSVDSKDVVSIISESGKMFWGVVLAYVTALLSR